MAQRHSEYWRMPGDTYTTPNWCWNELYLAEPRFVGAWDCCPANANFDFLSVEAPLEAVATNPPFNNAEAIIRHALRLTRPLNGRVALLLPMNYDAAKRRVDLWGPPFKRKLVMLRRIRWTNLEQQAAAPSSNHCWYVWDWQHCGPATLGHLFTASDSAGVRHKSVRHNQPRQLQQLNVNAIYMVIRSGYHIRCQQKRWSNSTR
jgi:hypothetical protein